MLVYGRNVASELLLNNKNLVKKIYLQDGFDDKELISLIDKSNISYKFITKNDMNRLANGVHQGIILDVLDYKYYDLNDISLDDNFIVMLDHIEDPHNFGAIIRTCVAAGVQYIIIPKDRSVSVNSTVFKTSAGLVLKSKIIEVSNLSNAIRFLKEKGFWIYSSAMDGESYFNTDFSDKCCLVIGNEGKGVSSLIRKNSDFIISIPIKSSVDSLNASVAAGILIYGVVRNRG